MANLDLGVIRAGLHHPEGCCVIGQSALGGAYCWHYVQ